MKAIVHGFALLALAAVATACTRAGGAGSAGDGNPWTRHGILRIVGSSQIDYDLGDIWGGKFYEWSDKYALVLDLVTAVATVDNGGISRDGLTS